MLSYTYFFVVLLPSLLKEVSKKIFSVLSNFYSLSGFQNTTVSLPFEIRHVALNPPPHLLRVSLKCLSRTLFFLLLKKLSSFQKSLLSILYIRCPSSFSVSLKIPFFLKNGSKEIQGGHHSSISSQASVQAASFSIT